MAQTLDQFLDTLSDEELELLDTDPAFFEEVKAKFATPAQPTFKDKLRSAYQTASKPAEMSAEGLGQLAEMVPKPEPTGNIVKDVLLGTPRIAAESIAEVAPEFIKPEALALGAVAKGAKPLSKVAGKAATKVGKIARRIAPSEKILKRGIEQAEGMAGIKQQATNLKNVAEKLGVAITKTTQTAKGKEQIKQLSKEELLTNVLNKVMELRRQGGQIPGQLAKDLKTVMDTELKKGSGFINQLLKMSGSTQPKALLARGAKYSTEQLSKAAPRRAGLAKTLGRVKSAKRKGKIAGGIAAAEVLRRALGNTLGGAVGSQLGG